MKMQPSKKKQAFPLQLVLIIPFVVQVFGAVGLVGFLSFKNGEKAVRELTEQLMERSSGEVQQHLDTYLSIPHKITQINADAVRMGLLNGRGQRSLSQKQRETIGKYFWHQLQAYDLTYIGLYFPTGEGVGAGRYDGKTVMIDDLATKTPSQPKNLTSRFADNQGNPTQAMMSAPWDVLNEPAYTEPVKAGKPTWVRINSFYDPSYPPYIAATTGRPVYDASKKLIGVVGAEIHLLKLSKFLRRLEVSRSGQVFIMERDGTLVANSASEQPFTVANNTINRLKAIDSPSPIVQSIAKQIQDRIHNLDSITSEQEVRVNFQGEHYHVQVEPWRDEYGLDWLVVTSIPENVFMAQINANTQTTILLCFGALVVAVVSGIFTSRWIARPILRLNKASQAMAAGNLKQTVKAGNIQELNLLADSFNHMAEQLRESFTALETSNAELEARVEKRTVELRTTLSELQRTQAQVIQSEKMSSLGQLVAGVAHEINNPVNFIHGNLAHVQGYTKDLLGLVQLYQHHYPNPVSQIQTETEAIDLEFIRDDLSKITSSMRIGTDRIREIVLSLRNFSRTDEAEIKLVDIHEGLDSTLMILQHRLKARSDRREIRVIKDYAPLPLIECYPGSLNQVFMNVLSNAIDALEEGYAKQTDEDIKANGSQITIRTCLIDSGVQITIADNGCGIPQEIQQRIFDPFFTTKPVGKGTGMGMSISYQIITERHGGKLECFSTPGEGTEFVIQIPIR